MSARDRRQKRVLVFNAHIQELQRLNLAGNRVGDRGAVSLGQALKVNYGLVYLDVSFNGISSRGASVIAHGLRENCALTNIQVTWPAS